MALTWSISLDSFAYSHVKNRPIQDETHRVIPENQAEKLNEGFQDFLKEFHHQIGASVSLRYACIDMDGVRFDEIDGYYFELNYGYIISWR